jgi:outer membrane protein assembly factor BamB
LGTGITSAVGDLATIVSGLSVFNGTLYAASYHNGIGALYTVNPANAAETTVGTSSLNYDDFGGTLSGLYAVDTSSNLYSINPSNGAPTLIGATGVSLGGFRSISANSSALYLEDGSKLYTLNTSTGAATLVGPTGGFDYSAMVTVNGTLYGAGDEGHIDTLNTSTGAETVGPPLNLGLGGTTIFGFAPVVPEPGGALSALAAITGVILLGRTTRRRRAI